MPGQTGLLPPGPLQVGMHAWCQQLPKFDFQTWTLVVSPALDQSGVPAFLPVSSTLSIQESLLRRTRLERRRFQPGIAPPPSRVCSSADLAWPAFIGVSLRQASPARSVAGQGVNHHLTRLGRVWEAVSFWAAKAIPCRRSDAYWLRHCDRHWPHTDTPDTGTPCPPFL